MSWEPVLSKVSRFIFEKEDGKYVVDVIELGYEKVLGKGKVTIPMIVKAVEISEKAREKIEAAGGEVVEL